MILTDNKKFLKVTNVKKGNVMRFLNEGEIIESRKFTYKDGTPQKQLVFHVDVNGQEWDFTVNSTNKKALIAAYGQDTAKWINKVMIIDVIKSLVSGEYKDIIILVKPADEQP